MLNDFKAFLLRGNLVDLAVAVVIGAAFGAVVIGAAFGAVVLTLVEDLITPLIAMIFGKPDFAALDFTINDSTFRYGDFINNIFTFVTIAAAVFFFVVVPVNALMQRAKKEPPPDPALQKCPYCLTDSPVGARRCAFCTSEVAAA